MYPKWNVGFTQSKFFAPILKNPKHKKHSDYNKNAESAKRWNDKWKNVVFVRCMINSLMRGDKLDKVQTSHLTLFESPLNYNLV